MSPIVVDGRLDEWADAPWTDAFVDIQGETLPAPRFLTRAKMLWDDTHFYVAADMVEPHLWGTLTERDAVIFYDNDFEVFIDPDGDSHEYYELEVNALGTEWDLMLSRPYRDAGSAIDSWDIVGLRTGIDLRGTLNVPSDEDDGWSIELAIPWTVLEEVSHRPTPPTPGDVWYVNFSRVQWHLDVEEGRYTKRLRPNSDQPLPEDNWVWSPQGLINMHYPEMWGRVAFVEAASDGVPPPSTIERARAALRLVYYDQKRRAEANEPFASSFGAIDVADPKLDGFDWPPTLAITPSGYEVSWPSESGTMFLRADGKIWFVHQ